MKGRATAPAAGTVLNALATGTGAAFAIDLETSATVTIEAKTDERADWTIDADIVGHPAADTSLVERCVTSTLGKYGPLADLDPKDGSGTAVVQTESDVPLAAGLKSSSAAANATVLATLDALDLETDVRRIDACRLGVEAARDTGVAVTGAFDDASASMLGGVTVTDNEEDELLANDDFDGVSHALIYTPPEQAYSADADVAACRRIASIADLVAELALDGRYGEAMSVNGFAFCAALGFDTGPMLDVLPDVTGVSLSGTGPSYVAVGSHDDLTHVRNRWDEREGTTILVETRTDGARVG